VTRWVVDAMNVIGSRPDGWWKDRRGAMRRLAGRLGELAATGDEVVVVYDGREFDDPPAAPRLEVEFAPGGRNAADRRIAARVEADPDPGSLTVVTSDRELAERVRAAGAEVEGSAGFRRRLDALEDG
jgi:predicted RNA-binding protein with PIN domain